MIRNEQVKVLLASFPSSRACIRLSGCLCFYCQLDIQPYSHWPSYVDMVGQLLPNLEICEVTTTPHLSRRTHAHVAVENRDDLTLIVPINGLAVISPENRNPVVCQPGEALLLPNDSVHQAHSDEPLSLLVINMPRALVAPRVSDLSGRLMEKVSRASTPELRLLMSYE